MKRSMALVAAPLMLACAYQPNPQSDRFTGDATLLSGGRMVRDLAEVRVPHDFGCPTEELVFRSLDRWQTVSVEGCGQRAVYTFIDGAGWVLNSSSTELQSE